MSQESRRRAWEKKQQRLEAERRKRKELPAAQTLSPSIDYNSNHPLVTPRVSAALAIFALLFAIGAPMMPRGTVPFAIGACYLLTIATGWLLRDEFRACLALFKGKKWSEAGIPNDFWLVLVALIAAFCVSTYVLTNRDASETKTVRTAFSDTQFIRIMPSELGGNTTLNLDNVGTLKLHVPYSLDKITLLLDVVPVSLPNRHDPSVEITDAEIYDHTTGKQYTFDTDKNHRQEIKIANRTFIVTLVGIKKLDVPHVPVATEYQFGISEK